MTAESVVNLRSGPGLTYPVIGRLRGGQSADVLAQNAAGDWLQVSYASEGLAWVSAQVVNLTGSMAAVAAIRDTPAPPVPATALAAATTSTTNTLATTSTPSPGVQYVIKSFRLRPVGLDGQQCTGGNHNIWVWVQDAAGNPLDGVLVHDLLKPFTTIATGKQGKGPGTALWDIYRGGGGQVEIVDGAGNVRSQVSPSMTDDWPDATLLWAAGYCACESEPSLAACQADLQHKTRNFDVGHYVYEVVFQRTW